MAIAIQRDLKDLGHDETLALSFTHDNNEITLGVETSYRPKHLADPHGISTPSGSLKERKFTLKVVDKETRSTMYYDVKLARVEIEKKEDSGPLGEHLEVIGKLYDEDENPFGTEFDDPAD